MSASPVLIEIVINVQINVKLGSLSPKRGQIFSRGLIDHRWPPFGGIWGILVWKIYKYCSKWNLKYLGAIHNFRRMVLKTLAPKMPIEHDHIRVINFQYYNFSCKMLPTNQAAKEALERIFPYIKMLAWFQSQKRIHACTKITCTKTTKLPFVWIISTGIHSPPLFQQALLQTPLICLSKRWWEKERRRAWRVP